MFEFTHQEQPWVCNGWESLSSAYDLEADDLPDWLTAYEGTGPTWKLLRAHYGIGPILEMAGQGCKDIKAAAKAAGYRIVDAERELAHLPTVWKKERALQKARQEARANALGTRPDQDTPDQVVGALRELDPDYVASLLKNNGFTHLPEAMHLRIANRILELAPQLNSAATRQQARNLIEMEIMLTNNGEMMQVLTRQQENIINRDDINEEHRVQRLADLQKTIKIQQAQAIELASKHANLLESIGADQVALATQKKNCLDQAAYMVNALISYYGNADNHLVDGVFTDAELQWLLTSTPYRPVFYRLPLTVRINEALRPDALWNPNWEPDPIPRESQRILAQITKEFAKTEDPKQIPGIDDLDTDDESEDDDEADDDDIGDTLDDLGTVPTEEDTSTPAPPPSARPHPATFLSDSDEACI